MDYITTIEMSKIWGISSRRIFFYVAREECLEQRKRERLGLIPKDAVKPTDPRKKIDDVLEVIMLMGRPEHWYILTTVARIPSPL